MGKIFNFNALLNTGFILFVIWFFSALPMQFETLNPISMALKDVELTDMAFSKLRSPMDEDAAFDEEIVLVNFGELDRAGIAKQLEIINKHEPSVIGIDAFFRSEKSPGQDFPLMMALAKIKNVVLVSGVSKPNEAGTFDSLETSNIIFQEHAMNGFANVITGEESGESFRTNREFKKSALVKDTTVLHFVSKIAKIHNPEAFNKLMERDYDTEIINWRGHSYSNPVEGYQQKFYTLDANDVLNEQFDPDIIKGKIVLFGYLGRWANDEMSIEDKFYTPLNSKMAGRSYPDMYGITVHANAISMVLHGHYFEQIPEWLSISIALLLCFINGAVFLMIADKVKSYYDLITKSIQFLEVILVMFVVIMIMHHYHLKLNLSLTILLLALVGDLTELYAGSARNLVITGLVKIKLLPKKISFGGVYFGHGKKEE